MNLEFINVLVEATEGPRIPHPEDAIFTSSAEAMKYVDELANIIKNPASITIKWDGGIALYFGYTPGGEFFISDKYMYPAGFYATSPQEWERYDTQVKASKTPRAELYPKIKAIWDGLKSSVTDRSVFKGDLMAVGDEMRPRGNEYVFKPVTVLYQVPVSSPLGKLMQGKVGFIVVHSMDGTPWDGQSGLVNNGNVAVINPNCAPAIKGGIQFKLNEPVQVLKKAKQIVSTQGPMADQFLAGVDGVMRAKLQTYFNRLITKQTSQNVADWLVDPANKISGKQQEKMKPYFAENAQGWQALVNVWNAVYQLKVSIDTGLQSQVTGFKQSIGNSPGGEGFVAASGGVKIVNRGAFGAEHFK